jgi:hypothetical protein
VNPATTELFRGERASRSWRQIARELAWLALGLLLLEIAVRRLELASLVRVPAPLARAWQRLVARRAAPRPATEGAPAAASTAASTGAASPPGGPPAVAAPGAKSDAADSVESALAKARRAAEKRLER